MSIENNGSLAQALSTIEQRYGISGFSPEQLAGQQDKIRMSINAEMRAVFDQNFKLPVAVVARELLVLSRKLGPQQMQFAYQIAEAAQRGENGSIEEKLNALVMEMSLGKSGGTRGRGGRGGEFSLSPESAAFLVIAMLLLMLLLSSCNLVDRAKAFSATEESATQTAAALVVESPTPVVIADTETPVASPTASFTPTNTVVATETRQPTATRAPEITMPSGYAETLKGYGYDKQFPLSGNDIYGILDPNSIKKGETHGDIDVIREGKAYWTGSNQKGQFGTLPLVMYNKKLDEYYVINSGVLKKGRPPSDAFVDALLAAVIKNNSVGGKPPVLRFDYAAIQGSDFQSFFEGATAHPSDSFFSSGDSSGFEGQERFTFPSSWNFVKIQN